MLISWLADIAVLAVAFLALGAQPPWLGLLLAYCAGQIASGLPVTPGGLGVVEATRVSGTSRARTSAEVRARR